LDTSNSASRRLARQSAYCEHDGGEQEAVFHMGEARSK
jgi:hypothetical protein